MQVTWTIISIVHVFVSACRRSHWCSFYSSVWVQPQNHPQVWIGHDSNSPLVDSNAGCILTCRLHFHFTSLPPFSARCGYDATRPLQNTLGLQRGVGRRQPETRHQPDAAQRRQPHQLWTDTAALQHHRDDGIGSHSVFVLFFSPSISSSVLVVNVLSRAGLHDGHCGLWFLSNADVIPVLPL